MNANGLYNGLDAGAAMGVYNGTNGGVGNGAISNETKPSNIPILDRFPGAAAAYSLRKLRSGYAGAAIRVRRSSDNAEQDILFGNNGTINENQLISFIGGNSGFVSVWYDQSLNGLNASRTVQLEQPRIVLSGVVDKSNFKIGIVGDTVDYLETPSNFTFTSAFTVGKVNGFDTVSYIVGSATVGLFYGGSGGGINGIGAFDGTNSRQLTGEDLNQHLAWYSMRGGRIYIARDGQVEQDTNTFAASLSINRLFGRGVSGGTHFNGVIQELIFYNSDQTVSRPYIEQNINQYYKIY
jgi:hypothetical protein